MPSSVSTVENPMRAIRRFLKQQANRLPFLAHRYRVWRDARFDRIDPQLIRFGFRLTGQQEMMDGVFEPVETAIVREMASRVDLFVDVGANIGYYVCHALQVNSDVQVLALEPLASNLRHLLRNIQANGWDHRCEVLPIAASAGPGILRLYGAGTGASLVRGWNNAPDSSATLVPTNSLDRIAGRRFSGSRCAIMIDVEGHEAAVIAGAVGFMVADPKPIWFIEIGLGEHRSDRVGNPEFENIFRRFADAGYAAWTCTSPRRRLTQHLVRAAAHGEISLGTHNFVFAGQDDSFCDWLGS